MENFDNAPRVGILYQNQHELVQFKKKILRDDYTDIIVGQRWKVKATFQNPLKKLDVIIKEVYSFHKVQTMKDCYNLSGMQFSRFQFVDGVYSSDMLNYLNGRIRHDFLYRHKNK